MIPMFGRSGRGNGSSGAGGPAGSTVEVADSSAASSAYGNNLRYTPLRNAQSDTISFQFVAPVTGTVNVTVIYAMSSAEAANVRLRFDAVALGAGDNPTTAQSAGTAFTITPGNDVLLHEVDSGDSASFAIAVTAGDIVFCTLSRLTADAPAHTGDMRVIEVRVS